MDVTTIEIIIRALNEAGVRYLVVGGLATVAHGHVRFTADIDLVLDLDEANLINAAAVLSRLGYRPRAPVDLELFADRDTRESWKRDKGLTVFSLWSQRFPMTEIDLFVEAPFDDMRGVFERAVSFEVAPGAEAVTIGRSDLLAMKRAAGRPKDLEDIRALEELGDGE